MQSESISVEVDILSDTTTLRWVPYISGFLRNKLNFDHFKIKYSYINSGNGYITPRNITNYSYWIESAAADRVIAPSGKRDETCYISTKADVFILNSMNISTKEAKKWRNIKYSVVNLNKYDTFEIPELPQDMKELVSRVENIDKNSSRINLDIDQRLAGKYIKHEKLSLGRRILNLLIH